MTEAPSTSRDAPAPPSRSLPFVLVAAGLLALPALATAGDLAPPPRYEAAVRDLGDFIAREVAEKRLPALSIAVVDDQEIVWARGFGMADPAAGRPASADTAYRVGSVSKLFTDVAVMQLVERGEVGLDEPIRKYLPDFAPKDPFGGDPITLRQLMAHRSGLTREPPVGSYFDPTSPPLAATIASLNATELIYRPRSRQKYSNAAIATVGQALEKVAGGPFEAVVAGRVLRPLGMDRSGFAPTPAIERDLARASMWTRHGREFPAPTFALGIAPAGSLYSTAGDLAKFLQALFAGGKGANGPVLKPATLEAMYAVQFGRPGQERGFGIGFAVGRLEGRRRVGHGGAVYGFATELAALPDDRLGVVVMASLDCANAVTTRIADVTLGHLLAAREGRPLPAIERTAPLGPGLARRWAGHYRSANDSFDLAESGGRLWMEPGRGGSRVELRASGADLVVDDVLAFGPRLAPDGDRLRLGPATFGREPREVPPPPPPAPLAGLIGEYGPDHDLLYILEKDGRPHVLIEWFFLYPLERVSDDVYAFPDSGLYQGEKLVFRRDPAGRATRVEAGSVVFARRTLDGEGGRTFRIQPNRPVAEIRREVEGAKPPEESGRSRAPDLVDLAGAVPGVVLDIRYASANNFLGEPLYTTARAFLQRPAAEALARVQARLAPRGYGLLVHDGYRPWRVTKLFWEATPPAQRTFVANPARGSRHNRGCAVDLSLRDLATGRPAEMVSGYDEFSDRAYPNYPGGTSRQRWLRELLREAMEAEGFAVNDAEWWHFDFSAWREYPILDEPFEAIGGAANKGRP